MSLLYDSHLILTESFTMGGGEMGSRYTSIKSAQVFLGKKYYLGTLPLNLVTFSDEPVVRQSLHH